MIPGSGKHFLDYQRALERYDSDIVRGLLYEHLAKGRAHDWAVSVDTLVDSLEHNHLQPWWDHSAFSYSFDYRRAAALIEDSKFDEAVEEIVTHVDDEHSWQVELALLMTNSATTEQPLESVRDLIRKIGSRTRGDSAWYHIVSPYLVWILQAWGAMIWEPTRLYLDEVTSTHFGSHAEPDAESIETVSNSVAWMAVESKLDDRYHPEF